MFEGLKERIRKFVKNHIVDNDPYESGLAVIMPTIHTKEWVLNNKVGDLHLEPDSAIYNRLRGISVNFSVPVYNYLPSYMEKMNSTYEKVIDKDIHIRCSLATIMIYGDNESNTYFNYIHHRYKSRIAHYDNYQVIAKTRNRRENLNGESIQV